MQTFPEFLEGKYSLRVRYGYERSVVVAPYRHSLSSIVTSKQGELSTLSSVKSTLQSTLLPLFRLNSRGQTVIGNAEVGIAKRVEPCKYQLCARYCALVWTARPRHRQNGAKPQGV